MNIKQAEQLSGVSRQNIRFYEREGLIHPSRNPENDYREYTQEDIHTLKLIRTLRMLDMPLEQIKALFQGELELSDAVDAQMAQLQEQVQKLTAALHFCQEIKEFRDLEQLEVDAILRRMETPENQKTLAQSWLEDYKKVCLSEREKVFTFIPESSVTNAREFTDALFAYANASGLDLIVTKEGMYPEFTINGIEYTAERFYSVVHRIPVATIRCTVKHPEDFEPDVSEGRKRWLKLLNLSWLLVPFILMNLGTLIQISRGELLSTWQGWLVLVMLIVLAITMLYRFWLFHFNEDGK